MISQFLSKITVLFVIFHTVNCANILYLAMLPSPSHPIFNGQIINALAERGHNVTVLSPYSEAKPPKNVHYLDLSEIYKTEMYTSYSSRFLETKGVSALPWKWYDILKELRSECEGQ